VNARTKILGAALSAALHGMAVCALWLFSGLPQSLPGTRTCRIELYSALSGASSGGGELETAPEESGAAGDTRPFPVKRTPEKKSRGETPPQEGIVRQRAKQPAESAPPRVRLAPTPSAIRPTKSRDGEFPTLSSLDANKKKRENKKAPVKTTQTSPRNGDAAPRQAERGEGGPLGKGTTGACSSGFPVLEEGLSGIGAEGVVFDLGEIDEPPAVIKRVPPRYPDKARRRELSARVLVGVVVDSSGRPGKITVLDGDPRDVFGESVREAVSRWTFKPAKRQGKAVAARVTIPIRFELEEWS